RLAGGGELAVGEVAFAAPIGAVEQGAVGPFEIQHQAHGFPYAAIGEHVAPAVHEQCLRLGGNPVGNLGADDVAAQHCREVVAGGPVLRLVFQENVEFAGL